MPAGNDRAVDGDRDDDRRGPGASPSSSSDAESSSARSRSPSPSPSSPGRDATVLGRNDHLDSDSPFRTNPITTATPVRSRYPNGLGVSPTELNASPYPYSPSASIALERASETLAGLGRQLTELNMGESDPDIGTRCCCGASDGCPASAARGRLDAKLKLCGGECTGHPERRADIAEIGTALLQRYEALELKHTRAEHQVEIKRKALADSLRHVANLERANTTHLSKYAELSRAFEALEKVGIARPIQWSLQPGPSGVF